MKNKHLLLIFLAALGAGLLSRNWRWPSADTPWPLLRMDTAWVGQIIVQPPQGGELAFERTDGGWAVEHEGRAFPVAAAAMQPMLAALNDLKALRRVPTKRPDTLGFSPYMEWRVRVGGGEGPSTDLALGQQIMLEGRPATYVRLARDGEVYVVMSHLRDVFFQRIEFFRKNHVVSLQPDEVLEVGCTWPGGTPLLLHRHDSLGLWLSPDSLRAVPADSMHAWLLRLRGIGSLPFADDFDESSAMRSLRATWHIQSRDQVPLTLRLFRLAPPDLPEEIAPGTRNKSRRAVAWVLHSSQNPLNYFSVSDTTLFFAWR
ncbi:MAG TPA: DUF4340 domain-containing protein [Saprospiraceae bacterium]|nr:DUF4340 domain-containing protein [Saprospiraceae bacterium]